MDYRDIDIRQFLSTRAYNFLARFPLATVGQVEDAISCGELSNRMIGKKSFVEIEAIVERLRASRGASPFDESKFDDIERECGHPLSSEQRRGVGRVNYKLHAEIVRLRRSGLSYRKIAEAVGVSINSTRNTAEKLDRHERIYERTGRKSPWLLLVHKALAEITPPT